jgi:hypothetical protein
MHVAGIIRTDGTPGMHSGPRAEVAAERVEGVIIW